HPAHRAGLPLPPPFEAQHVAGNREDARNPVSFRGRLNIDPFHRGGRRTGLDEIGTIMASTTQNAPRDWGIIAGNGDFPFLVLEGARSRGIDMAVIAIREEASPALERAASRFHW